MKFSDKDLEVRNLIKCEDLKPCNVCKEPTEFIDYCYECRCCSEECEKKLDDDYEATVNRMMEFENNECDTQQDFINSTR